MATVQITFKTAMQRGVPVEASSFVANETFTSSGTSQETTAAAGAGEIAVIDTDGAIRVAFGASPTAAADDTCQLLRAGRWQFTIERGHKVAIIDA